jgi:CheY-like chemotaxis protein
MKAHDQGCPFDIVLVGTHVIGISVETFGRNVGEHASVGDTPRVLLTSSGTRGDALRARAAGYCAYLVRPVLADDLHDCIAQAVGIRARTRGERLSLARFITRHTLEDDRRKRVRILVVDDNPTNQQVALGILHRLGYSADVASNGAQAIEAATRTHYDAILMDCQMPDMDGYQATKKIREIISLNSQSYLPILALSADTGLGHFDKANAAGMDDSLSKPILPDKLAMTLRYWLSSDTGRNTSRLNGLPESKHLTNKEAETLVFNEAAFLASLGADRTLARQILSTFIGDTAARIPVMTHAWSTRDTENVKQQAHTIKGAAANLRASALNQVAAELEALIKKGEIAAAEGALARLQDHYHELKTHLETNGWL